MKMKIEVICLVLTMVNNSVVMKVSDEAMVAKVVCRWQPQRQRAGSKKQIAFYSYLSPQKRYIELLKILWAFQACLHFTYSCLPFIRTYSSLLKIIYLDGHVYILTTSGSNMFMLIWFSPSWTVETSTLAINYILSTLNLRSFLHLEVNYNLFTLIILFHS